MNFEKKINKIYISLSCSQDAIKYSITGSGTSPDYFYMDPDTGLVTLKMLLAEGSEQQYTVRGARKFISFINYT